MNDVNRIIEQARNAGIQAEQQHVEHANGKTKNLAILLVAIIAIVGGLFFIPWDWFGGPGKAIEMAIIECDDLHCFVHHGKNCLDSTYTTEVTGLTIHQTVESDCTLKREVIQVASNEADMVKDLNGLSMECKYQRGNFNPRYGDTIIGMPTQCQGQLLDRIRKIAHS